MTNQPIPFHSISNELKDLPKIIGIFVAGAGHEIYACSNCEVITYFKKNEKRPVRFGKCNNDFNWVGIKTKVIKECLNCGKVDKTNSDLYCSTCPTSVNMIEKEVDI